jgi:hypothetical protein
VQPIHSDHKPPTAPPARAVVVPGVIAVTLGAALGTIGAFGAGFGMGTDCTDFSQAPHACDGLTRWLDAGLIGQWALVLVAAILLTIGYRRPLTRRPLAAATWVAVILTIAWYGFYYYGGYHSYRHHY